MGTSLFDRPPSGPLPDPIAALLESLRQGIPMSGAHQLPAMVSTATPLARNLPATVSSAPHVPQSSSLPAMHSYAPPAAAPMPSAITSLLSTLTNAQMPGMSTTPGAPPPSGLLANVSGPPMPGALQGAPANVAQAGAPQGPPMTPPVPGAGPMPQIQSPPESPSLFHRILSNLTGAGHGASNDAPSGAAVGYAGLLSPDEIKGARLGFFDKLATAAPGSPSAEQIYRDRLDNILKMHQMASAVSQHQQVLAARASMPTLFPEQPDETIDQTRNRLGKMYAYLMAHGDEEGMKEVGSTLRGIMTAPRPDVTKVLGPGSKLVGPNGEELAATDPVPKAPLPGSPEWKAAEEFKASLAAKYRVDPTQIIQGVDDEGDPRFFRVPKNGGDPVPIGGMAPKTVIKTENAQQELTRARAEAAVSEMNNGAQYMHDFERRLASGQAKIGNASQIIGSIANTFTHDDPVSKGVQNTALTALNKTNPDLARYIRRALSFAEGESMISSRPSDFRTRMSAFLSQAASGASPDMISDIESRRNSILTPLNRIYSQASGAPASPRSAAPAPAGGNPAGGKRVINADQAAFLKTKKGMTDADIAARYTVRP